MHEKCPAVSGRASTHESSKKSISPADERIQLIDAAAESECIVHDIIVLGIPTVSMRPFREFQFGGFKSEMAHESTHLVGAHSTTSDCLLGNNELVTFKGALADGGRYIPKF